MQQSYEMDKGVENEGDEYKKYIYAPDITPYSLIPFQQRKIKRKFKYKGRRYTSAKIKGKDQRIGHDTHPVCRLSTFETVLE